MKEISHAQIVSFYEKLKKKAEASGYFLNPDLEFTHELIRGLITNNSRYGYQVCPCRLSAGNMQKDLDIICPCDYRDDDVAEFGMCYCCLYVSQDVVAGKKETGPIPERRPEKDTSSTASPQNRNENRLPFPVWRCRVCGYLCAKENPPEICPICKATKDRFEQFMV